LISGMIATLRMIKPLTSSTRLSVTANSSTYQLTTCHPSQITENTR
jgi:hypothetical protein